MTTATEHIESIMLLLGQEIHERPEEIISTGSNAQPPGMTPSQEPEYLSDEEFFPGAKEHSPHKISSYLQRCTLKSRSGKDQRWADTLTKLRLWQMIQYDLIVFLDADSILTKPLTTFWMIQVM
jgi:hypothetical protein